MIAETSITRRLEATRLLVGGIASRKERASIGQFFTPSPIADFMASLFDKPCRHARILDPGCGVGTLFAALIQQLMQRDPKPDTIEVVAYETDTTLERCLRKTIDLCGQACAERSIEFSGSILTTDFISSAVEQMQGSLFRSGAPHFTHAILNPPYRKINGDSHTRRVLSVAGLETSNLYAAFVWLAAGLLAPGGEIVAITPRSFCNGPYFRHFRKALIDMIALRRIHLFQSRKDAFKDDSVLQENVILYGVRDRRQPSSLRISVSEGGDLAEIKSRRVSFNSVVVPGDKDAFIHLVEDDSGQAAMERMTVFETTLDELDLEVSTGRVVDFRAREFLRDEPEAETVPLLYPCHLADGSTQWPLSGGKKPNAIAVMDETMGLLVATDCYVLVKRFTSKEEPRRVVAAVLDPGRFRAQWLGIENHLNYFHSHGRGVSPNLAKGLALFLNSTLLDRHFRLFSGHTQVNATDLRKLRYPTRVQLVRMGRHVGDTMPSQEVIDQTLQRECGIDDQT